MFLKQPRIFEDYCITVIPFLVRMLMIRASHVYLSLGKGLLAKVCIFIVKELAAHQPPAPPTFEKNTVDVHSTWLYVITPAI